MTIDLIDRIVENCMNNMGEIRYTEDFVQNRLKNSIELSNLPSPYYRNCLDTTKLPKKILDMVDILLDYIPNGINCMLATDDYVDSEYFIATAIEHYITHNIIADEHIYSVLYIDTNLLLSDMKKLFSYGKDGVVTQGLGNSYDIISSGIYNADYIFWNRFGYIDSEYDFNKMLEILTIRYNRCKGNMFCVNASDFSEKFASDNTKFFEGSDIRCIMNVGNRICDLIKNSSDIKRSKIEFANTFRNVNDVAKTKD